MGSVDFFIKIGDKKGESEDAKHKGEIDVLSWSFGCTQAASGSFGGGSGAGKVSFNDFHFMMHTNKASPELMLACASGEHIKEAVFVARRAGKDQQEYLKITMSDVLISSYQSSGSASASELPVDSVSLNFTKIKTEYKPQKEDGTLDAAVSAGWNLKGNVKY